MPEVYATEAEVLAAWPGLAKLADGERSDLVAAANAAAADALQREILLAPRVERHSGANRGRLWLRTTPVASVESVSIDGVPLADGSWAFDPETGELVRGDGRRDPRFAPWFPRGFRNVEVAYTAGFDPVPAPVRRAVILIARAMHDLGKASGVYRFEMIGNYSYSLGDATGSIPAAALSLLRDYQAPGL